MPSPWVKNLSKETGKSEKEIEKLWSKAKEITADTFGVSESDFEEKEYKYTTGVVKNMLGLDENYNIASFMNSKKSADDFITEAISSQFGVLQQNDIIHKEEPFVDKEDEEDEDNKRQYKQDGTGPHGQGAGPGKGKADGSGMKEMVDDSYKMPGLSPINIENGDIIIKQGQPIDYDIMINEDEEVSVEIWPQGQSHSVWAKYTSEEEAKKIGWKF